MKRGVCGWQGTEDCGLTAGFQGRGDAVVGRLEETKALRLGSAFNLSDGERTGEDARGSESSKTIGCIVLTAKWDLSQ